MEVRHGATRTRSIKGSFMRRLKEELKETHHNFKGSSFHVSALQS